jgi:predicted kinase
VSSSETIRVPVGLVILVGPPASGKTSFVRALIERGRLDEAAVISSDQIRAELSRALAVATDSEAADSQIFAERDRRIIARLSRGHGAVAESTNVTRQARARLVAIARRFTAPVTMLRFEPDLTDLLRQHADRARADVTVADVRRYATLMARHAAAEQLRTEGVAAVYDVPGRREGATPIAAAERFYFDWN